MTTGVRLRIQRTMRSDSTPCCVRRQTSTGRSYLDTASGTAYVTPSANGRSISDGENRCQHRRRSPPQNGRPARVRQPRAPRNQRIRSRANRRRAGARPRPRPTATATVARRCASAPWSLGRMARSLAIRPPTMSNSATLRSAEKPPIDIRASEERTMSGGQPQRC